MNFPVFDLHCDTALAILGRDLESPQSLRENKLHIDLSRGMEIGGYAQCFACFTTPDMEKWYGFSPTTVFEKELETIRREIEKNSDIIAQAYCTDDILENRKNGKISAILTIEGPAGFDFDPELLETLYMAGVRISTLGWNENNPLTGSHVTGNGLTDIGREYVRQAQKSGIIVDVSHISDKGFWDIMDITSAPVIASHSNSRKVWDSSRNLTDEMFLAICKTGGVAGINLYTDFLGKNANMDTVCDHIFHFLELDPSGTHIALGGDLDGCETLPDGIDGIQSYPSLALRLIERGLDDKTVENIFWNNAMGVMKLCST